MTSRNNITRGFVGKRLKSVWHRLWTVPNHILMWKLTHISEWTFPELEIESEPVRTIRDFRRLSGTLETVLRAVVDRVGEAVGTVDRAIRWTYCRLAHETFCSWKFKKIHINSLNLKLTSNSLFFCIIFLHEILKIVNSINCRKSR